MYPFPVFRHSFLKCFGLWILAPPGDPISKNLHWDPTGIMGGVFSRP